MGGDQTQLIPKDISLQFDERSLLVMEKTITSNKTKRRSVVSEVDVFCSALMASAYAKDISSADIDQISKYCQTVDETYGKKYEGRINIAPEVRMLLTDAFLKKKGLVVEPEDILLAGINMKRVVQLVLNMPVLGKVADALFLERSEKKVSGLENILGKQKENDLYFDYFKHYNEQIIRGLSITDSPGIVVVGRRGVDTNASVVGAIKQMRANFPSYRFVSNYLMDLSSLVGSQEVIERVVGLTAEEIQSNSPAVLTVKGIEFFGDDWKMATELLEMIRNQTGVKIILLIEDSFYKTHLDSVPELLRFGKILIEEFEQNVILQIIGFKFKQLNEREGVVIEPGLGQRVYDLSKRYLPGIAFPEKALTIIEELAAQMRISGQKTITEEILLSVFAQKTNLPIAKLTESEKESLSKLEQTLSEKVIGQDEAVKLVSQAIRRSRSGLKDPKKPIGSFLFLGPTGVGKTELAKTLGVNFFGDEKAFIRLDMSEFAEPHTVMRLIGSPPGYVGYDEGGQLTNAVAQKPYCLVLFDEIEKAHPKVFDIFLQILDEGRLTDSKGNLVDFKNTILIFTSNIGAEEIFKALNTDPNLDKREFYQTRLLPMIKEYFRIELINRFDEIVIFNPLSMEVFKKVVKLKLGNLETVLAGKGLKLTISDEDMDNFVRDNADQLFGARSIERAIKEKIETPISEMIINNQVTMGQTIVWSPDGIKVI